MSAAALETVIEIDTHGPDGENAFTGREFIHDGEVHA